MAAIDLGSWGVFSNLGDVFQKIKDNLSEANPKLKPTFITPDTLELIWIGDSTTDKNLTYATDNSPTYVLHEEFDNKFLKPGRQLYGAKSTVYARSGATTQQFLDNTVTGAAFTGITDVINYCNTSARVNQIIVLSLGHNDGITVSNWNTEVLPKQKKLIDKLIDETNAFIVLRMPNAWASAYGCNLATAQDKSAALYSLYQELGKQYKNRCLMVNIQDILGWRGGSWADTAWYTGGTYSVGSYVVSNGNVYRAVTAGTAGATAPSGTGASISDGGVTWAYESYLNAYMSDWTHPSALGYQAIANVIGNVIAGMVAAVSSKENILSNKPFALVPEKLAELPINYKDYNLIYEGTILAGKTTNGIAIDMDFKRAKTTIQYGDLIVIGGGSNAVAQYVLANTLINRVWWDRQPSTAYLAGDYAMVNFSGSTWLCKCMASGTTSSASQLGAIFDGKRLTNISDGSVVWRLLRQTEMPTLITFYTNKVNMSAFDYGDKVRIYRRAGENRFIKQYQSPNIDYNKYVKIAEMEINLIYKSGSASLLFACVGSTHTNTAVVNVTYSQTTALPSNPSVEIIVNPISLSASDEIVAANFIAVPVESTSTLTRIALYYKTAGYPTRNYGVTLLGTAQNDPDYPGHSDSNAPYFYLSPEIALMVSALPATAAGCTNKIGVYNSALYLQSTGGTLKKITVNDSNVISAANV